MASCTVNGAQKSKIQPAPAWVQSLACLWCCSLLFQMQIDKLQPFFHDSYNAEYEKLLGWFKAAGYSPRVLSKNNLVKMWTENHRPLLSPEHMQLWSVWYFKKNKVLNPNPQTHNKAHFTAVMHSYYQLRGLSGSQDNASFITQRTNI